MTALKRILWTAACLICIALGFVLAQQYEQRRAGARLQELQQQHESELAQARSDAEARVDTMARTQGEMLAQNLRGRYFASGIVRAA